MSWILPTRSKPIKIVSTSDWHFGNNRIPSIDLANRFRTYLFPQLEDADLLNIGGDIWDTILTLCESTNIIEAFLLDLLQHCNKHNVTVRILLGTYSHDRTQSSIIPMLQEKYEYKNDLKYIDRVSLEYIEHLDLRILYLPDDLPFNSSEHCLEFVHELLKQRDWNYIDYVFGHGYFDHMLPSSIPRKPKVTFHVDQFKDIVRRYILMGHVHQSNFTDNVFYNNSFDRLAHGEEDPKGYIKIIDFGDKAEIEFIENKDATKFITLDLSSYTDQDELGKIYINKLKTLFGNDALGYIRIMHPSVEIRQFLQRLTSSKFPHLVFTSKKIKDDHKDAHKFNSKILAIHEYPSPTEDTLPEMVYQFIAKENHLNLSLDRIRELLI